MRESVIARVRGYIGGKGTRGKGNEGGVYKADREGLLKRSAEAASKGECDRGRERHGARR